MDDKRSCTCSTQFVLNNLPRDQREHLMKKDVREEISKHADVDIVIRGRYSSPKENCSSTVDTNRQLHLHITGRTKQNLNMAIKKIDSLLGKTGDDAVDDTCLEEKITVGIDVFPSIFHMRSKILGENEENVFYITKETGAVISLHGKGSGSAENKEDPLYVFVRYKDVPSKPKTQELVLNLIETVQQDFIDTYGKYYPRPKEPEIIPITKKPEVKVKNVTPFKETVKSSKSANDNSTSHIEKITLGLSHVPSKFNLKSKIYGPNLSNVKHIEKVSSAVLLVEGVNVGTDGSNAESVESPHILVKYLKPELKDMARSLILNLIETIQQEYISLYGAYLSKPETPEIILVKANSFKPPEKTSVSSTLIKHPIQDPCPMSKTISNQLSADANPVPPPPPVISKAVSPSEFIKFTPNYQLNGVEMNANSFKTSEPVKPVYSEVSRPNASFAPQNIKPIPSIVPPVGGISSQPQVPSATLIPQTSSYVQPPEIQPILNNVTPIFVPPPKKIQPILNNNLQVRTQLPIFKVGETYYVVCVKKNLLKKKEKKKEKKENS